MSFEPIKGSIWDSDTSDAVLFETDIVKIRTLLVGHKVEKVADDHLMLDNGTVLRLEGNEGGCSCGAGDYFLTKLNGCDNIITNVEVEEKTGGDDYGTDESVYRIFVFAEDKHLLAEFEGYDGNGYYGTGFNIAVRYPEGAAA